MKYDNTEQLNTLTMITLSSFHWSANFKGFLLIFLLRMTKQNQMLNSFCTFSLKVILLNKSQQICQTLKGNKKEILSRVFFNFTLLQYIRLPQSPIKGNSFESFYSTLHFCFQFSFGQQIWSKKVDQTSQKFFFQLNNRKRKYL